MVVSGLRCGAAEMMFEGGPVPTGRMAVWMRLHVGEIYTGRYFGQLSSGLRLVLRYRWWSCWRHRKDVGHVGTGTCVQIGTVELDGIPTLL